MAHCMYEKLRNGLYVTRFTQLGKCKESNTIKAARNYASELGGWPGDVQRQNRRGPRRHVDSAALRRPRREHAGRMRRAPRRAKCNASAFAQVLARAHDPDHLDTKHAAGQVVQAEERETLSAVAFCQQGYLQVSAPTGHADIVPDFIPAAYKVSSGIPATNQHTHQIYIFYFKDSLISCEVDSDSCHTTQCGRRCMVLLKKFLLDATLYTYKFIRSIL